MIELEFRSWFDPESGTLFCGWNSGLFSNFSTCLHNVIVLLNRGIHVRHIDFSEGFHHFRDDSADLYPRFFRPSNVQLPGHCPVPNHHSRYCQLDFPALAPLKEAWFSPSAEVTALCESMAKNCGLQSERAVAVFYRGTDKGTELTLASPQRYIRATRRLMALYHLSKVLIQTDQAQVRDLFLKEFGDDCVFFGELPVTDREKVIHLEADVVSASSRRLWAQQLIAAVMLVSQCKVVIQHTGNMAYWAALYRGTAEGLFQFDVSGRLVAPSGKYQPFENLMYAARRIIASFRSL